MNKVKWRVFYRKVSFADPNELLAEIDPLHFPALRKLSFLTSTELMLLTVLLVHVINAKGHTSGLLFKHLKNCLREDFIIITNETTAALYRLFDLGFISISLTHCISNHTAALSFKANKAILIEQGIYTPDPEFNIWDLPTLYQG